RPTQPGWRRMRLKTYRARTMADALAAVKKDLGPQAVIVHTKTTQARTLFGLIPRNVVEIVASDEAPLSARSVDRSARRERLRTPAPPRQAPQREFSGAKVAAALAQRAYGQGGAARVAAIGHAEDEAPDPTTAHVAAAVAEPPAEPSVEVMPVRQRRSGIDRLATPARLAPVDNRAQADLHQELASIKRMVSQVLSTSNAAPTAGALPEHLFNHYLRLLESEMARDVADEVVGRVRDEL